MLVLLFQVIQVLTLGHVRGEKAALLLWSIPPSYYLLAKVLVLSVLQSQCGKCFSSVKHSIPCTVSQQKLNDHGRCLVQVQSVKKIAATY